MARRKKITNSETLSKESEKVQETLLKEIIFEEPVDPNEIKESEKAEIKESEKAKIKESKKEDELKVGDRVKIKSHVETDTLGRRIHNGVRNYTYTILAIRPDNFVSVECLTYCFLLRKDQIDKI